MSCTEDKYKDSGVEWLGEIPSHWDVKRLGSFFEERREKVSDVDYPALSVTKSGIVPQLDTAAKTDAGDNRKLVKADDFVINSRSDRKGSSGISPYTGSVSLISIVMEPRTIYPAYAHHLLRSYPFQEEFYRYGKGIVADLWSTNSSEMKNILLPVIPITEQQNIANFLDHETAKIDSLIEKQQQLIQLLKEKRQAVISHAVTKGLDPNVPMKDSGVEWLGSVPEHWNITTVRNLIRSGKLVLQDGNHGELHPTANDYVEAGIPFLMANNVRNGNLIMGDVKRISKQLADKLRIGFAKAGDMLLTHKGTVGEVALIPLDIKEDYWMLTPQVTYYRWLGKKFFNKYFYYQFQSFSIQSQLEIIGGKQSTRAYVGLIAQGDLVVAIPPINEQLDIASNILEKDKNYQLMIYKAESAIQLMQERRTVLISSAVTGKIDVRNWQNPTEAKMEFSA